MISSAFPPVGGSGVQRPAKFAKYLARSGWRVIVWTAGRVPGLPQDERLVDDLPDSVERHSTPVFDPQGQAGALAHIFSRPLRSWPRLLRAAEAACWRSGRAVQRLLTWSVPDERAFWAWRSLSRLRRLVRESNVDVVFSTFSPASNHLLAYWLHRRERLPWVADFRDLWTDDCGYAARSRLHRRLDRQLEQRFLESAGAVIGVSPSQTRTLADHVPNQREKFHTITNGVDLEDFPAIGDDGPCASTPSDRFTLAFVGHVQSRCFSAAHVEGLARFARRTREWGGRFEFKIVGRFSEAQRRRFRDADVAPVVTGYVDHGRAIAEMAAAHVLLLPTALGNNGDSVIPAKLFEYLAAGRPILVTGDAHSEPWRIVSQLNAGLRADVNPAAIDAALTNLWRRWRHGVLPPGADRRRLPPYSREHLAAQLEEVFERVMRPAANDAALSPAESTPLAPDPATPEPLDRPEAPALCAEAREMEAAGV